MKTNRKHRRRHSNTIKFDYSLPEWDLLGLEMFVAGTIGLMLSVALYCVVYYI